MEVCSDLLKGEEFLGAEWDELICALTLESGEPRILGALFQENIEE
jgi:hypothetical protein